MLLSATSVYVSTFPPGLGALSLGEVHHISAGHQLPLAFPPNSRSRSAASLTASSWRICAPAFVAASYCCGPSADRKAELASSLCRIQKLNRGEAARLRICAAALRNLQAASALPI